MKAYSMDLRVRVLADCDAGLGTTSVARAYRVSSAWVRRLKQRRRETGEIAPRRRGGGPHQRKIDRQRLKAAVADQPDATLVELRQHLGVNCSLSAICKVLKQLKLTYKKRRFAPRSRIVPT